MTQELVGLMQSVKVLGEGFGVTTDTVAVLFALFVVSTVAVKTLWYAGRGLYRVGCYLSPTDPIVDPLVRAMEEPEAFWTDYCCKVVNGKYRLEFEKWNDGPGILRAVYVNNEIQPIDVLTNEQKLRLRMAAREYHDYHVARKLEASRKEFARAVRA